jgi:hypothetical protein
MAYICPQPNDPAFMPGAILESRNGLVRHRGIRGRRNPFTGEQPILHSPKDGAVQYGNEWEFCEGRPIRAIRIPVTPQAGEIAIQRMESILGLPWTLPSTNCQHTTNWAALGVARSEQYEALIGIAILAVSLFVAGRN